LIGCEVGGDCFGASQRIPVTPGSTVVDDHNRHSHSERRCDEVAVKCRCAGINKDKRCQPAGSEHCPDLVAREADDCFER